MKYSIGTKKRNLLRIIVPAYPVFNVYSFIADKTTSLGAVCVASAARETSGWEVEIIDENNLRRLGPVTASGMADHNLIQKQRPADVVGFYGGLTSTIPRIYDVARFYKDAGVVTIAGGQHFVEETIPEALSSNIDCIVLGEGEETIKELLQALRTGNSINSIAGLAYKDKESGETIYTAERPPVEDLDALPLPDFSMLRHAKIKLYPVGRVRGCGMHCEFCAVKAKPRYASAQRLVEQVSKIVETMGGKQFFIVDDLFGQDRDETLHLCDLLKKYQEYIGKRLRFTVQIRLDRARDEELLRKMRAAGIRAVAIGFESPILEELRAMNKQLHPDEMVEQARMFHKLGFFVHGMFIFGYPMRGGVSFTMSARERVKRYKNFIRRAKIDTIQSVLPVPLPGTALRKRLERAGRIFSREDLGWEYYDASFPLFKPDPPLTAEEMQLAGRKIMGNFYNFKTLFLFLANLFSFPHLLFYGFNIKSGWRRWYRRWRNYFFRFAGSRVLKKWTIQLNRGKFLGKLKKAQQHL